MGSAVLDGPWKSEPPGPERLHTRAAGHGSAVVVHVEGEIDFTTADVLREAVRAAVEPVSPPRVVLDFERVAFCDSSGLGALVAIWKAARAAGGDLVVARPPGICRRMLERTGLERHIAITATLDKALSHLDPMAQGAPAPAYEGGNVRRRA